MGDQRLTAYLAGRFDELVASLPAPVLLPSAYARHRALIARRAAREQAEQMRRDLEAEAAAAAQTLTNAVNGAGQRDRAYLLRLSGLRLSLADRWAIFGTTGSGKTTLALELMTRYRRLFHEAACYVLDSKPDPKFDGDADLFEGDEVPPLVGQGERLVWRPYLNNREMYDAWLERLLRSPHPFVLLIDEVASLGGNNPQAFPLNYILLLKQGRALGKAVISMSQEAAYQPRQILGMTTHVVRMRLQDDYDKQKIDRLMHGAGQIRDPLTRYGFWYKRLDPDAPARHYRDWRELLAA